MAQTRAAGKADLTAVLKAVVMAATKVVLRAVVMAAMKAGRMVDYSAEH